MTKTRLKALLLIAGLLWPALSASSEAEDESWPESILSAAASKQIVGKGLDGSPLELVCFKDNDKSSIHYRTQLCWATLPHRSVWMDVHEILQASVIASTFKSAVPPTALVAVTGSYFGYDGQHGLAPLGLVVSNGRLRHPLAHWTSGAVIYQAKNIPQVLIAPIGQFSLTHNLASATQTKPLLVRDGVAVVKSRDNSPFNRAALALDSSGKVIVIGAFSPEGDAISLADFAKFATLSRSKNGPGAKLAADLDGGPGAQLYFPQSGLHLGYEGTSYIPNMVSFADADNEKQDH